MPQNIVVIGGGIAGLSAAESARKEDPYAKITLVSCENDLPYYRLRVAEILAKPEQAETLYLRQPSWFTDQNIEVILKEHLTQVDTAQKTLSLSSGQKLTYDKLVLATGSRSRIPEVPGSTRENVFSLWTKEDAERLSRTLEKNNIQSCAVIGGGVLGLEAAWQLHLRGIKVSILEFASHLLLRQLNPEASTLLADYITSLGIDVYTSADTVSLDGEGERDAVRSITLRDGRIVPCDAVLFSIGVLANTSVAEDAGLAVDRRIKVDQRMQSSDPYVFAAGDNCVVDESYWFGLWAISMNQGKVAGTNAAGGDAIFEKVIPPYMVNTMETRIVSQGYLPTTAVDDIHFEDDIQEDKHSYKRVVYKGDDLVGFILIGEAAKEMVQLQKIIREV